MNRRTELTVRTSPHGGEIASHVSADPQLRTARRVTILVHGYNNSERQARRSYRQFLRNTSIGDKPLLTGQLCEFYWPGDFDTAFSALSYPLQVARAHEAAERLRAYLARVSIGGALEVSFVCHSLGSRIALEFILAATRSGAPQLIIARVCLLAAAVPVEMVYPSGRLHVSVKSIRNSVILWSRSDRALGLAFRIGQALAGEHCSGAVGSSGDPTLLWTSVHDLTPYGHSDYWKRVGSAAHVARAFEIVTPQRPLFRSLIPSRCLERREQVARESMQRNAKV